MNNLIKYLVAFILGYLVSRHKVNGNGFRCCKMDSSSNDAKPIVYPNNCATNEAPSALFGDNCKEVEAFFCAGGAEDGERCKIELNNKCKEYASDPEVGDSQFCNLDEMHGFNHGLMDDDKYKPAGAWTGLCIDSENAVSVKTKLPTGKQLCMDPDDCNITPFAFWRTGAGGCHKKYESR